MNLVSTRNSGESIPAIAAVLKGIAGDGGLSFRKFSDHNTGYVYRAGKDALL